MVRAPYREVGRLYALAIDFWPDLDGEAALNGVNLLGLPPARFLNIVYHMATRNMDEKDRAQFDFRLGQPVVGEKVSREDAQSDLAAFDAFAAVAG